MSLAWEDYGRGSRNDDLWRIAEWRSTDGGSIGAAIHVRGKYIGLAEPVRRDLRNLRERFRWTPTDWLVIPLHASLAELAWGGQSADAVLLDVIFSQLAERPALRANLENEELVTAALAEMATNPHQALGGFSGLRRKSVEVSTAMTLLGYAHDLGGRPLPGEQLPTTTEATKAVLARLARSPYARGITFDETRVARHVERHYTAVPPWPTGNLLVPPAS